MKLVKALIWPVITYGAEGYTLKKDDERRLEAGEMWCYRRLLRISWTEKNTNKSILDELQTRRELLLLFGRSRMIVGHHRLTDELFPAAAIFCSPYAL